MSTPATAPHESIAVIPARGGSKRIPQKNIAPFRGKPMIAWPIAAARTSGLFSRIVVSTDNEEIARIARLEGAEVPFSRPKELADDYTATVPVMAHAIHELALLGCNPVYTCCLYPTALFVTPELLRQFRNALTDPAVQFAFPIIEFEHSIFRGLRLINGAPIPEFPQYTGWRSQDLPTIYHDAGQLYFGRTSAFKEQLQIFASHSRAIPIPRGHAVDIDTPEDLRYAEVLHKYLFQSQ